MTNEKIPTGDTLEMTGPDGTVWGRLVHLGGGICNSERLTSKGNWEISKTDVVLTDVQAAEWLKRKEQTQ